MANPKKTVAKKMATFTSTHEKIPVTAISDHPKMSGIYRPLDKTWAKELAASIVEAGGLDNPIIVSKDGDNYYIVAGRHRMSAINQIKKSNARAFKRIFGDGIPATVREGEDFTGIVLTQLRENLERKTVTPEEIFPALNYLLEEEGLKQKDVAKRLSKSEGWVSQMLVINEELPDDLKAAVLKQELPVRKGQEIAREIRKAKASGDSAATAAAEAKVTKVRKALKEKTSSDTKSTRRHSLKTLYGVFQRMSHVSVGRKNQVLEGIIQYALSETDDIPKELQVILQEDEDAKNKEAEAKEEAKKKAAAEKAEKRAASKAKVAKKATKKTVKKATRKIAKKRTIKTK